MKTLKTKRLDQLHALYERGLVNPSKQKRQGARAMRGFAQAIEELRATELSLKELSRQVAEQGGQKRRLKTLVSELTEELVTCYGKGSIVIDGQAWHFGEDQFGKVYAFSHKPRVR